MKIGILGGTFNPIHTGHLILAQNALEYLQLDRVLFIPSGVSYLKDSRTILSAEHRIRMVELAIQDNPAFSLSTIETEREGNSYTYETLLQLKEIYPDAELYFICGADILMSIHTWKEPAQIMRDAALVVAPRDFTQKEELEAQKEQLILNYNANVILLDTTDLNVSSSGIREHLAAGRSARYYVPDPVLGYIKEQGLYLK